jgi:hypothetical protein
MHIDIRQPENDNVADLFENSMKIECSDLQLKAAILKFGKI